MATLSKGLALFECRTSIASRLCQGPLFARARLFQTSSRCRFAAQPIAKPPSSPSPSKQAKASPSRNTIAPSRYAFTQSLASKSTPTTLYEAPSHFWFYVGCWSSGAFLIGWTALTGPNVVFQPQGVPTWVGYVFGSAYVIMGAMGFYIVSKTPNIVQSIRLLPSPARAASKSPPGTTRPRPQIEVTVKRMMPAASPRVLKTSLDNVTLQSRFVLPSEYVPDLKRREIDRLDKQRKKELHKFDMEHLLTMPFRRLGRGFVSLFKGIRSAWTDSGFGVIVVNGKKYKVDVTRGFAHDGFRTLERLVAVEGGK